jgi:23S rRNA pseudouridine1911/1915/1917 synthase
LYEDEAVLVVNKPHGLLVTPGHRMLGGSLLNRVIGYVQRTQGIKTAFLAHRLDAQTSGLVLVAKTDAARIKLQHQFMAQTVSKSYLALCTGRLDHGALGLTYPQSGRAGFVVNARMGALVTATRFSKQGITVEGKEARTEFEVLASSVGPDPFSGSSEDKPGALLVRCVPITGRTHQIRVHLLHAGLPIVGDTLYGPWRRRPVPCDDGPLFEGPLAVGRHALHASSMTFEHPMSGTLVHVEAPVPQDFMEGARLLGLEKVLTQ